MIAPNPRIESSRKLRLPAPKLETDLVIDRSRGLGPCHFLLVPGLVPDGPETFLRQKKEFLARGDVSTVTWPYEAFDLEVVMATFQRFLDDARKEKRKAVLVGVSVGGGMVLEFLRRCREKGTRAEVAAVLLISPLTCVDDLAPMLKRLWVPIVTDTGEPVQALEKGRSFFRQLASRSAGTKGAAKGWKALFAALTPAGIGDLVDASIRKRIEKTLGSIPPSGAIARCKALQLLPGLESGDLVRNRLTDSPTLILWGSKERHTLNMDGPGTGTLCRPDLAERHFNCAEIHWVYTKKGDTVPHASLLKHDKAFVKPIRRFLKRI